MNLWGFTPELLPMLESAFRGLLTEAPEKDRELHLPVVVGGAIRGERARVRVLPARGRWAGVTSAEDLASVRRVLADLVARGVYPARLWG
jgi:hypothetical protein